MYDRDPHRRIGIIGIAMLVAATGGCAEDACRGSDEKYYNEALALHLAKRGVPYKVSGSALCVSARNAEGLRAAEADVEATFPQVAHLLRDSCEERAFVDWAKREGLRFDLRSTVNSRNQPGRMFLLRSFTAEEVASNKAKLANSAPKGATCTDSPS
jgi:hypothetical protein